MYEEKENKYSTSLSAPTRLSYWVYLLIIGTFILRIYYLDQIFPYPDELDYWTQEAQAVIQANFHLPPTWFLPSHIGGTKHVHLPLPLYPYLGAALTWATRLSPLLSLRLISVAANSLCALWVYFIGLQLFSPAVAALAAAFTCLHVLSTTTSNATVHPFFTFLGLGFMLTYIKSEKYASYAYAFLAGLFLALALLTQWTGLLLLAAFIGYLTLEALTGQRLKFTRRQAVIVLVALGISLPYALNLYYRGVNPFAYYLGYHQSWEKAGGSRLILMGINIPGPLISLLMFASLFHGSPKYLWLIMQKVPTWLLPLWGLFILIPLGLLSLGLWQATRHTSPSCRSFLHFLQIYILAFVAFYMFYKFKFTTYWVTVFPVAYLFLAQVVSHYLATFKKWWPKWGLWLFIFYFVGVNVAASVHFIKAGGEFGPVYEVAAFLAQEKDKKLSLAFHYPSLMAYHFKRLGQQKAQIISLDQVTHLTSGPKYIVGREDYLRRYFDFSELERYYRAILRVENKVTPFRDYFVYQKIYTKRSVRGQ